LVWGSDRPGNSLNQLGIKRDRQFGITGNFAMNYKSNQWSAAEAGLNAQMYGVVAAQYLSSPYGTP